MVVRVKIRLKALKGKKGKMVDTIALLNAGLNQKSQKL